MATKFEDRAHRPKSTGAYPAPEVETEHVGSDDNTSTGAVEYVAPGETVVSHYDEEVTVNYETPGPVTMSVSWLSDDDDESVDDAQPVGKVVGAPQRPQLRPAYAKAETE